MTSDGGTPKETRATLHNTVFLVIDTYRSGNTMCKYENLRNTVNKGDLKLLASILLLSK